MNWFNKQEFEKEFKEGQKQQVQDTKETVSPYLSFKEVITGTIEEIKSFRSSNKNTPGIEVIFVENEETSNMRKPKDYKYGNRRFTSRKFYLTPKTLDHKMYFSPMRYFLNLFEELGKRDEFVAAFPDDPIKMDVEDVIDILKDFVEGTEFCTIIGGEQYVRASDGEIVTKGVLNIRVPGKPCGEEATKFLNEYVAQSAYKLLQKPKDDAPTQSSSPDLGTDTPPIDDDLPF